MRRSATATAETVALPDGELVLDRYRLERRLGSGGFGAVWQARDVKLERDVAVKVIPRDGSGDERAEREARAAARLNHPGIVGLYELGADEGDFYLVSELVPGRTLAELAKARALSDRDVARIGSALCEALEHAHGRGVIHRDVKPQNVMVLAEPAAGAGFAKLADFGVAHLASGDPLTRTGDVVGTLAYMAPEQAEGERVSPACDVYSLALTLYEAWTGTNPVRANGPAATARRLGRPLPPLASKRRDLPRELSEMVDLALHPEPEARPAPGRLRTALRRVEDRLSDKGGLVEPATLERFGLTAVRRAPALPLPAAVLARLGAGVAAGGLGLAAVEQLAPEPGFSPLAAAGVAALLVALLPRVGWIASALVLCGWLASPEVGREGTALVLAAGLAPVPLLLPRAGLLWSVPALAPLLGTIALAPAFVALSALSTSGRWRAGLAAAGFLWLALGEVLFSTELLFGVPDGVLPRAAWEGSLTGAASDALVPLVTSPALAPLAIWALFAWALPLVLRGRSLALDLVVAAGWAAALVAAHAGLADMLAATTRLDEARGAAAGALLGVLAATAVTAIAPPVRESAEDRTPYPAT
jgi:serine/threonine protein kinase